MLFEDRKISTYKCIKTMKMDGSGEVAFKKGKYYQGHIDESGHGKFKSDFNPHTGDNPLMDHGMNPHYIKKYLKLFTLGR